jgi:glycogen operon protein
MATLFVSQGVPMLEMGDELWRTQRGNNNAYCHDSELTWVDWRETPATGEMLHAAQSLASLRRRLGALRRRDFLRGGRQGDGRKDISWLRPDGIEMDLSDWKDPARAAIAFRLEGDPSVLVLLNGEQVPVTFGIRRAPSGASWRVAFDARDESPRGDVAGPVATEVGLAPGTLMVLVADLPVVV